MVAVGRSRPVSNLLRNPWGINKINSGSLRPGVEETVRRSRLRIRRLRCIAQMCADLRCDGPTAERESTCVAQHECAHAGSWSTWSWMRPNARKYRAAPSANSTLTAITSSMVGSMQDNHSRSVSPPWSRSFRTSDHRHGPERGRRQMSATIPARWRPGPGVPIAAIAVCVSNRSSA